MQCPSCGHNNPSSQRFCGSCGAALVGSDSETIASPSPTPPRFAGDAAGFVPGQILAGRYRMVGLLGRGGMGEVYRADDLKLGQPVALKFLPRDVEADGDRLNRFLTEVRFSLKVTHPNVCRVFDIAEVAPSTGSGQGRHFLSMEFVDGEDLQSLLRRIGRLPEDKAVEIARQLCAGLAAAHDEGVLHRDLKPSNVMIDGRGRAKITDFGLAGATAGIAGREAQAGTPQYMAPEQFDGRELSVQTDLYSLGLVLYELFTGKRAFDGRNINELKEMHSSTPTSPSAHVAGLNPIVERAILRCVDPDPARRPKSASSLAAALPGGDPVEMAIAAGETPSPEMVAQSGGGGELKPAIAIAALVTVLVGLGLVWVYQGRTATWNRIALPKTPAELRVAARAALATAGYTAKPGGSAFGFIWDTDYFSAGDAAQSPSRSHNLTTVEPVPLWFWYRESARPMTPLGARGQLDFSNPPFDVDGMARVRVDPSGRLRYLGVVPPDLPGSPGPWPEPDWTPLFAAAGYTLSEWSSAEPLWALQTASDVRRAWTKGTLRLEAASLRGKPVSFGVLPEWTKPTAVTSTPDSSQRGLGIVGSIISITVVVAAILLAHRNIRQGRSDLRGATRFAVAYLALGTAYELLRLSGNPADWPAVFMNNFGDQVTSSAFNWVFYVALELYVRRLWPGTLVAWTRALEGRLRDPMIGRHILLGALAGLGYMLLFAIRDPIVPTGQLPLEQFDVLRSPWAALKETVRAVQVSFSIPVSALLGVLLCRVVFRRPWIAYLAIVLFAGSVVALVAPVWWHAFVVVLNVSLILVILTRLGLLACLVMVLFSLWSRFPLTTDTSSWFFPQSIVTMACFAAVAIYGFWVSLGNQKVFKESMLEQA